ncbi:MAG: DUF5819 family protein [Thermoanaerobaculia bacterium]
MWWACFVGCGVVLAVHFSLVQLGNMPLSPLKLNLAGAIASYVNPYFAQRWNFFAPQPIERDVFLVARARFRDPQTGSDVVTGWINVSDPLIGAVRKNRLSPLFLVEVGLSNSVLDFENGIAKNKNATFQKDGKTYLRPVIPATVDPFNIAVMTRTALATLQITYATRHIDAVQLGLLHYTYPRFTERHRKISVPKTLPLTLIDWQPASTVAPYCCTG